MTHLTASRPQGRTPTVASSSSRPSRRLGSTDTTSSSERWLGMPVWLCLCLCVFVVFSTVFVQYDMCSCFMFCVFGVYLLCVFVVYLFLVPPLVFLYLFLLISLCICGIVLSVIQTCSLYGFCVLLFLSGRERGRWRRGRGRLRGKERVSEIYREK